MIFSYLILVIASAGIVQFGVGYCRSIVAAYADCAISSQTREIASLAEGAMRADDFGKLLSLVRMCPLRMDDSGKLSIVRLYFSALGLTVTIGAMPSRAVRWAESERARCAHAAAVMLDHRVLATASASATARKF